jgi:hypothetical protein
MKVPVSGGLMDISAYEDRWPRRLGEPHNDYARHLRREAIRWEIESLRGKNLTSELEKIIDILEALNKAI